MLCHGYQPVMLSHLIDFSFPDNFVALSAITFSSHKFLNNNSDFERMLNRLRLFQIPYGVRNHFRVTEILQNCQNLRQLSLLGISHFDFRCLRFMPYLESLSVRSRAISVAEAVEIANNAPKLENISMSLKRVSDQYHEGIGNAFCNIKRVCLLTRFHCAQGFCEALQLDHSIFAQLCSVVVIYKSDRNIVDSDFIPDMMKLLKSRSIMIQTQERGDDFCVFCGENSTEKYWCWRCKCYLFPYLFLQLFWCEAFFGKFAVLLQNSVDTLQKTVRKNLMK